MSLVGVAAASAQKGQAALASITSNGISPPAGSLLVALIGCTNGAVAVSSVTDSLGVHLNWTKLIGNAAQGLDAEIWIADCPNAQTNMTVTANFPTAQDSAIGVIALTGAAAVAAQLGATGINSSASGTPSAAVVTNTAFSWVVGCGVHGTNVNAPTIPNGQTNNFAGNGYAGSATASTSWWGQGLWASAGSPDTGVNISINDTAPAGVVFTMVAAEILPASANSMRGGVPVARAPEPGTPTAMQHYNSRGTSSSGGARPTTGQLWPRGDHF